MLRAGILALQGAFAEHKTRLEQLGIECMEIRQKKDLSGHFDGLILPGGESTVQGKLLRELSLLEPLKEIILSKTPVLGTCAGLILLASHLSDDPIVHFGTLPVTVRRNAYGRQLGSFRTTGRFSMADAGQTIPMTFIRAPYIESIQDGVQVLSHLNGNITAVRYQNQLGICFHPELEKDNTIYRYFIQLMTAGK